jgi:hypothetical protein
MTSDDFRAVIRSDIVKWSKAIKQTGIRID